MPNFYVFTPDGKVHELEGLPSSMEYQQAYAYAILTDHWYRCWTFAGLNWSPINNCDVPEKYAGYIKLLKLIS